MSDIRQPIKKNSIATKERLIKKGFELICSQGYHHVTSADIAKYAGVATGSVYQYFPDKRAIFLAGTQVYAERILTPVLDIFLATPLSHQNLADVISQTIDAFIKNHTLNQRAHAELMSICHLDPDFAEIFKQNELRLTDQIVKLLPNDRGDKVYLREKIHLALGMVDQFCHEAVYHQHPDLDYDVMKTEMIKCILNLL